MNESKHAHEDPQQDAVVDLKPTRASRQNLRSVPPKHDTEIDRFVEEYIDDQGYYDQLSQLSKRMIAESEGMSKLDPRPLCISRVKHPNSVKRKLHSQKSERLWNYADLVGIRVLIYYPNHAAAIEKLLMVLFEDVRKTRGSLAAETSDRSDEFGYRADIYHVKIRESDRFGLKSGNEHNVIEVQVVSLLMNTWAEVEHKRYKGYIRDSTLQEDRVLEELHGIVLAGERKLQELHELYEARQASIHAVD
jgi:ppGpp synthetase/RelA/SpoT-type nucleotidyltranferase